MEKVYFDYAASTPVAPEVLKFMEPYFSEKFGNPGSLHSFGQEALVAVDKARETVARAIGADFQQIIFTSSATEANNLVLRGAIQCAKRQASSVKDRTNKTVLPKLIVSAVEHSSVLDTAVELKKRGEAEVAVIPVDKRGVIDLGKFKKELNERTLLVSVMLGNNEIGTIEPIAEIAKIIMDYRDANPRMHANDANKNSRHSDKFVDSYRWLLLHTDAAQAFPYVKIDVGELGVNMLTLSSQKIYGPKGAGALYMRHASRVKGQGRDSKILNPSGYWLDPIISGGGQEYGLRAGTENVPALAGFGKAVEIAERIRTKEARRLAELKTYFWERTKKAVRNVDINGPAEGGLPHILNLYFPGRSAEEELARLDLAGFAVSYGSACVARAAKPSHVLLALGHKEKRARESIRVSFGRDTTKKGIDALIEVIKNK